MTDLDADLPRHVERVLAEYLDSARHGIAHVDAFAEPLGALTDFVLGGGKRIRPTFAWWAWRAAGGAASGEHAEAALRAVAALELIQACALIHDDVMDDSHSRRGAPTVHVAFSERHAEQGWRGSAERFGLASAVLIGDLALAWADDMFTSAALPESAMTAGRPVWHAMRTEVLAGQYLDVHTQVTGDPTPEAAMRVNELKTAAYTVARPLHLGAALGGAGADLIDALRSFGNDIGVAFQLRDDLLGVLGDPAVTGKPAGDDLREGKRTLLIALGLEHATQRGMPGCARAIRDAVDAADPSDEQIKRAIGALIDAGAVESVELRISRLNEAALTTLDNAKLGEPAASRLTELAHAATSRTY
ncbi:polyprenyl synthetase family protein [Haloechinothrix sp. LS1_15]|uniref:polyprenyl synthetase family protein n=1 Tax=Haloechinothrix sp. LS1_15 TaxID=2652248 RepID=UPI002945025E|nr:polyprenyl synthetase family protein [Haloechinothrix sp. LS1_15]MDV6012658.1 polyprenyl synthetase family protein [Haloechinothrix sp. LS1_15]